MKRKTQLVEGLWTEDSVIYFKKMVGSGNVYKVEKQFHKSDTEFCS